MTKCTDIELKPRCVFRTKNVISLLIKSIIDMLKLCMSALFLIGILSTVRRLHKTKL